MENPRNLPFAMYDLAVYLPSGAVGLLLAQEILHGLFAFSLPITFGTSSDTAVGQVITAVIWLSASYLVGHIIAFVSSYAIEKYVHNKLGYPSDVWLAVEHALFKGRPRKDAFKKIFRRNLKKSPKYWVPRLLGFLQLPAFAPLILISVTRPFGFYTHKLPHGLLPKLEDKFGRLGTGIKVEAASRWEKLVEHYVANTCPLAYTRMYNYLVIYGALRAISLLVLSYLWYMIIMDIRMKVSEDFNIDVRTTLIFNIGSVIYVICLMAFAKFNRRYFEETILAFILGAPDPVRPRARTTG